MQLRVAVYRKRRFPGGRACATLLTMESIAVLVVDRERAVAQAVAQRLADERDLVVLGSAHTAQGAIAATERHQPDVVVFDEGVVAGDLADVLARLVDDRPSPRGRVRRLVVTSETADGQRAYESIQAGASAFVPKADGANEMVRTIHGVVSGETRIPPAILSGVLDRFRSKIRDTAEQDQRPPLPLLTPREREVLECLTAGLDRTSIARQLGLSVHTVRSHTQSIFAKLDVHSSVEAVSVAARAGIVSRSTLRTVMRA